MTELENLMDNIKKISLENLSDKELDALKEEIIKLLVDIQMQKEINVKLNNTHISTDDVQMEIMQKMKNIDNDSSAASAPPFDIQNNTSDEIISEKEEIIVSTQNADEDKRETVVIEYQKVIKEIIPEDALSVYSGNNETKDSEKSEKKEEPVSFGSTVTNTSPSANALDTPQKIIFKINDKFRIIRKLFNNDTDKFNGFVDGLNTCLTLSEAENYIKQTSQKYGWDEECFEYKTLVQQNQIRFK
ncbi:MAG: hypothetical protein KatS3mg028_1273 [Bacteroidia bacterium]|nr:MAG: hypothetical protein KatS3mg028_1273 [Bacteroidia bacterium]